MTREWYKKHKVDKTYDDILRVHCRQTTCQIRHGENQGDENDNF